MLLAWLLIVLPALVVGLSATHLPAACACDCAASTMQQRVGDADVVVRGRVVAVTTDANEASVASATHVRVAVTHVYKGTPPTTMEIDVPGAGTSCAMGFRAGDDLLFFSNGQRNAWRIDVCGGAQSTDTVTLTDLAVVAGAGSAVSGTPVADPGATPAPSSDSLLTTVFGGLAVTAIVIVLARRRWDP